MADSWGKELIGSLGLSCQANKMTEWLHCTEVASPDCTSLWLVDLTQPLRPEHLACLAQWECERAARFKFDRDEHRYQVSHVALRQLLGRHLSVPPAEVPLNLGSHGKPYWPGYPVNFNLSHSQDWALIGVHAHRVIGVDIEVWHAIPEWDALAQHNFTEAERAALHADGASPLEAFLRCWTRKEACLKALGSGLSVEPITFEAGVDAAPREVTVPNVARQACRMHLTSLVLPPLAHPEGKTVPAFGAVALVDPRDAQFVC